MNDTQQYVEKFEEVEKQSEPSWLRALRKAGIARFAEIGFPTLQQEDWRFTNVAPIAKLPFKPSLELAVDGLDKPALKKFTFGELKASRLVFLNGLFSAELSSLEKLPEGVKVGSLAAALKTDSTVLEKSLSRYASPEDNAFNALNLAFFQDGAFIYVPANTTVAEPIHLVFVSTSKEPGATAHPRNLVIAEKNSRFTVLETYSCVTNAASFTNAVTEFVLADGANVEHCKFQDESDDAFHMAGLHAHLGRSANFISHSIAVGAKLSRNNIRTNLAGEGVECILNGLYLTKDDQLADHHMVVEHAQPNCNSHEYFNGILDCRSKGVFHGRILVRKIAQKTDAKQTNKNLLLSDNATVDTKPQLEIYADDVKCTHGATVGQLNDESIFYLRARGIGEETARRMLIHAFAGEIIDRVRYQPAREELDKIIWNRLEENERVAVEK
jgi:Fe-S cluster assembly protein SufD